MAVHVHPRNDERPHVLETTCWCGPRVDWIDPDTGQAYPNAPIVVHHAADCRELAEGDGRAAAPGKLWAATPT